jgi:hypothetical protein
MSTIKHTPAPWRIEQEPDLIAIKAFRLDNASDICALPDGKIDQANARLIAAAPELLAALRVIAEDGKRDGWIPSYHYGEAQKAIAKAEGRAE